MAGRWCIVYMCERRALWHAVVLCCVCVCVLDVAAASEWWCHHHLGAMPDAEWSRDDDREAMYMYLCVFNTQLAPGAV